jgi:hypothetical protein
MLSAIRKRLTYANVAMTLALVFAMSGGAYAANKYLITSTKQISPKVLKSLKGKAGANGAQGPAGAAGATGAGGPQGPVGAAGAKGETGAAGAPGTNGTNGTNGTTGFTKTLPSKETLKGQWSATGWNGTEEQHSVGIVSDAVTFPFLVENEAHQGPAVHYIKKTEAIPPPGCTGNAETPGAEPGNLCVFATAETENSALPVTICNYALANSCASIKEANPSGFVVQRIITGEGLVNLAGTWAVTAE